MKQLQLVLCLVLILLVSNAMADEKTTVLVPQALDISYVNGDEYTGSLFSLGPKELSLDAGAQHLVVQYNTIWELDADDHERITSEPIHLSFTLQAGQRYQIKLPAILEVTEAEKFVEAPTLYLVNKASGQEHVITASFQAPVSVANESLSDDEAEQQALDQLRYWWSKASQLQREKFMAEIISAK